MRAGLLLLTLLLLVPLASAHATLQSATPAANGHVDVGVTTIELRFTEDVETEFTDADLLDTQGESWAAGPIQFDEAQHNVVRLPVRPLADGIYSASWKALSIDTHTTRGSFVFAVGNATLDPGLYPPTLVQQDAGEVARDGFGRFAFYAGLFLVVGIPLFALLVLREPAPPAALFRTAAAFGIVAVAGAAVGLLFLGQRTELGWGVLASAPARSFVWRGALVALATLACLAALARPTAWRAAATASVALGALAILATSLGSHAASVKADTALYVTADTLHLAMGAIWIGGIVGFLHVLWGRTAAQVGQMVVRFSPIAIASVVVLLATGTIASLAHMPCARTLADGIPCLGELRTESYVRLVAFKLLLMAPLVALGAFNKYRVGPRLATGAWTPRVFRRVVQVEAIVMALILGAAGILAASAPPDVAVEQGQYVPPYLELQNVTKASHVILQISPNPVKVGVQKIVVAVHPLSGRLSNSTIVQIKVWGPDDPEPDITTDMEKVTPNEWERTDGFFTSPGTWHVQVLVQRPEEFVKLPFKVEVAPIDGGTGS
ncbi:MAG TPA: copper resistance protein CopC [Candidatus Thermoplasmatota archaeon]|nr:copper resistance protein CopC [Candidatus Thermoplasmatota archaeon]